MTAVTLPYSPVAGTETTCEACPPLADKLLLLSDMVIVQHQTAALLGGPVPDQLPAAARLGAALGPWQILCAPPAERRQTRDRDLLGATVALLRTGPERNHQKTLVHVRILNVFRYMEYSWYNRCCTSQCNRHTVLVTLLLVECTTLPKTYYTSRYTRTESVATPVRISHGRNPACCYGVVPVPRRTEFCTP